MKRDTRTAVLNLLADNPAMAWAEIAQRLGVSRQRVHQIAKGAGKSGRNTGSALGHRVEYQCWANLIARCVDPEHKLYRYYGGRGIRVCDRWLNSFPAFLADMGPKPVPELSIDRINNDGNYEPGNCRWATKSEQVTNRRPNALAPRSGVSELTVPSNTKGRRATLTKEQAAEAAAMMRDGHSVSLIAKHFKCSRGTIRNYTVARRKRR